ncbi:MAG: SulP family inorganic anion transporter, partial [Burkholderiaceae bacterium]
MSIRQWVRLHRFSPRLFQPETLKGYDRSRFAADLGAGITVGIVALPLAMAFAIASGVKPEQGIFTAIIAGFLIATLGGSHVQIGGPAGAFIVIVYGIVQRYGVANLLVATVFAGGLLFLMGWLRLGALVRNIPVSIVVGFTNGIAVLIGLSQLKDLFGLDIHPMPAEFFPQITAIGSHLSSTNLYALGLGTVCLGGLFLWPRLFGSGTLLPDSMSEGRLIKLGANIPGPIVALVTLSVLASVLELPVETIGTRFGGIPQSLPSLVWPSFSWSGAQQLFIPTITIAMLGAIESLLCARVADGMAAFKRHDPNQELMAQGVANIVAPFFGGIPATGTIARTVTNLRAGAVSPIAGIIHCLTLLGILLVAAPLAASVPLAVLAGVLLYVAWNMGDWREFAHLGHHTLAHRTKLLSTFLLTVVLDLTVAVQVGLVLACIFFIYRMSTLFRIEPGAATAAPPGVRVYALYGSLFFGEVGKIETLDEELPVGSTSVVLETHQLVSIDSSGLDALQQLQRDLARRDVRLMLCGLNEQPLEMIRRAQFDALLGEENLQHDLAAALVALTP